MDALFGGNFHVYYPKELNRLVEITAGLERALGDFHRRGKVPLEESLDNVNKYLEQLRDPKKAKGFTSIPYLSDLVIEVKKAYDID